MVLMTDAAMLMRMGVFFLRMQKTTILMVEMLMPDAGTLIWK